MKKRFKVLIGLACFVAFAIVERYWVDFIERQIEADDYEIEQIIAENRELVESNNDNKYGRPCFPKNRYFYHYAYCFRYWGGESVQTPYIYINPRPLTAFSRLFFNNKRYREIGVPIGKQVGWIMSEGDWKLIRQIPVIPSKANPNPRLGSVKTIIVKSGKWR